MKYKGTIVKQNNTCPSCKRFFGAKRKPIVVTPKIIKRSTMRKVAVCVGINNYPNPANNLRGCVNDANSWANLLKTKFGFDDVTIILNDQATLANVKKTVSDKLMSCQPGDVFTFTNSSHGSTVPDKNKDESDGRDECLCLYDEWWIDDDLRSLIDNAPKGVNINIISDSCHSGTVTRAMLEPTDNPEVPRYIVPEDKDFAKSVRKTKVNKSFFTPSTEEGLREILISGCKATEYSMDAYINGKPCGAFTYFCMSVLQDAPIDITYQDFYKLLRKKLPSSQYRQTPQLEGSLANRKRAMFT